MNIKDYYNNKFDYRKRRIDVKRIKRWLKYVPFGRGLSMLDVGCGIGDSAEWAKWYGMKWTGIDFSITATKLGRLMGRDVQNVDAQQMPFQDNAFDVVVAFGSIEHFDDPAKGLDEMYRVLTLCGYAVIVVPNRPTIESLGLFHGTEQPQELRMTKKQWGGMIQRAGFTIRNVRRDYGPAIFKNYKPVKILQRLAIKLTRFLPDCFVYEWIFDCRKELK